MAIPLRRRAGIPRGAHALVLCAAAVLPGARGSTLPPQACSVQSFRLKPNPPNAGEDAVVIHEGTDAGGVSYRIGDGEWVAPKVGADGKFVIPKSKLVAGQRLYVRDENGSTEEDVCVRIEPARFAPHVGRTP